MKVLTGQEFQVIAELRDRPRKFIGFTYDRATPKAVVRTGIEWKDRIGQMGAELIDSPDEGIRLFDPIEIPPAELKNLPVLTYAEAVDVIEHAFYSGGDLATMVQAYVQKGRAGMENYAEVQSMFAMPSSPYAHLIGTPEFDRFGAEDVRIGS